MKPGKTWWLLKIHPWLPWNNTKFTNVAQQNKLELFPLDAFYFLLLVVTSLMTS